MKIQIRRALLSDLPQIYQTIEEARAYLKENNVDQWQNGFPNPTTLTNDITNLFSFVIEADSNIAGFLVISLIPEPPYHNPVEGSLKLEGKYATIHRTAFSNRFRGLGLSKQMFDYACDFARTQGCSVIRIDTHKDNKTMQHILAREGFEYCCLVQLPPEDDLRMRRVVFEKAL